MFEPQETIRDAYERWEQQTLWPALERAPERDGPFMTTSSAPVERLYTPLDLLLERGGRRPFGGLDGRRGAGLVADGHLGPPKAAPEVGRGGCEV